MKSPNVLLYFVKYPEPGRVKTRLAQAVGDAEAARLYREVVESNLSELGTLPPESVSLVVTFDPPEREKEVRAWLSNDHLYFPQKKGELGERLGWAFEALFGHGAKKVLAVGSDTIGLRASLIEEACEALNRSDLVLGPAKDGGYYLIGLSRPEPRLFENIPWSTPEVFNRTVACAKACELSYTLLEELEDLDQVENLKGVRTV
jgi:hypothetical protein